jgi:hypothetical protein
MGVARSRSSSFQEMLESIRPAKESGEFQKPDFAKKPAPQPAEEKAKRGDKI